MDVKFKVLVCHGPECGRVRGSAAVHQALAGELERARCADSVELGRQSCFGRCTQGPNVLVRQLQPDKPAFSLATAPRPGGTALYSGVQVRDVEDIVHAHILGGRKVRRLIAAPKREDAVTVRPGVLTALRGNLRDKD